MTKLSWIQILVLAVILAIEIACIEEKCKSKRDGKTLQLQTNLLAVKLSSGILHTLLIWLNSVKDPVLVHARNNGKQKVEVHIHSELFSH